MSNPKSLAFLLLTFLRVGYSLKCYSYFCSNSSVDPSSTCAAPQEFTCVPNPSFLGLNPDRCDTKRLVMEKFGITVRQEIRNCSYSVQCNMPDLFCNSANITGALKKCEIGCCQGDLCNSGGPIPTRAPQPTGPSGGDLTCYSCTDYPIDGKIVSCKTPVKQTCGASPATGMAQDRCLTLKVKANLPGTGTVEQVLKNCSDMLYCDKNTICRLANTLAGVRVNDCQASCCFGSLCNSDKMPTTAGPTTSLPSTSIDVTGSPISKGSTGNPVVTNSSAVASTKIKMHAALISLPALFLNFIFWNFGV